MNAEHQPVIPPVAQESPFTFPLEIGARLSASVVWQAQRSYFERSGIDAWRSQTVPHYVTNNPRLAASYAEVVLGFMRDLQRSDASEAIDPAQPLYLIELGSGCGRFGFFFLRAMRELLPRSSLQTMRFCYVMTDFAESVLAFLRTHPALAPFIEQGILDFGRFDLETDYDIKLERAALKISPASLRNPLVVIANYVFDGVSQDAFLVKDGELLDHLISVYSDVAAPDLSSPNIFEHLAVCYTNQPAPRERYPEPEFNAILKAYAGTMKGTTLSFPRAALRCIQRLAALSRGRMLLLSGDKGEVDEELLDGESSPEFTMHGSFSLSVNYHAIGEYCIGQGGQALLPQQRYSAFKTSAFLLGFGSKETPESRLAYDLALGGGAADDFFVLRQGVQEHYDKLMLKHLLALLRLSRFDPKIMRDCLPAVWAQLDQQPAPARNEVTHTVIKVWENYFHLGEDHDLAFDLGSLLYALGEYEAALRLFEQSALLYGDDPRTIWNQGLCYCGMRRTEDAVLCFTRSLNAEGEFKPEGGLQEKDVG